MENFYDKTLCLIGKEDLEKMVDYSIKRTIEEMGNVSKDVYLTVKELTDRYNISRSTLWRWEKNKYLVPTRFGRKLVYKESDVIKCMGMNI